MEPPKFPKSTPSCCEFDYWIELGVVFKSPKHHLFGSEKQKLYLRSTPHPVTVTTRIITFLVGNPYKPSFATVTGWGVDPNYTPPKFLTELCLVSDEQMSNKERGGSHQPAKYILYSATCFLPKKRHIFSTRWFNTWPFYSQTLEVTFTTFERVTFSPSQRMSHKKLPGSQSFLRKDFQQLT